MGWRVQEAKGNVAGSSSRRAVLLRQITQQWARLAELLWFTNTLPEAGMSTQFGPRRSLKAPRSPRPEHDTSQALAALALGDQETKLGAASSQLFAGIGIFVLPSLARKDGDPTRLATILQAHGA